MKFKLAILFSAIGLSLASCEYDNYDAPNSILSGRLVYNGEPINVSYNDVSIQLWQDGFAKRNSIPVSVAQDGSFSARLFDGDYKFVIPSSQGPFRSLTNEETNSDTILINLRGSKSYDIDVMPYYMVRNTNFTPSGRTVNASFGLEKIITDANAKDVETVFLFVSKTAFVDERTQAAGKSMGIADITDISNISMSVDVPTFTPTQNYVFARVGVKIAGVEDRIFSPIVRVDLQ